MLGAIQNYFSAGQWLSASLLVLAGASFIVFAVILTKTDIQRHRLPNKYVFPMYLLVGLPMLCAHWAAGNVPLMNRAGWSGIFLLGIYYFLRKVTRHQIGFGDVKLAGVLGIVMGFFSPINLLWGSFVTFMGAGLYSIVLVIFKKAKMKSLIPLGPFMFLGTLVALFAPMTSL